MITVTLTFAKKISNFTFTTLTEALEFARSTEIGTAFKIYEANTLLAKGKIEDLKEKLV